MQNLDQLIEKSTVTKWGERVLDERLLADLIVKECIDALWNEECCNSDLAYAEFARNRERIKNRLGVE
jgi:hypothetical protein